RLVLAMFGPGTPWPASRLAMARSKRRNAMADIKVRKGMPNVQLDKAEFKKRFLTQFYDPAFEPLQNELDKIAEAAWDGYDSYRKAPRIIKAGQSFADPRDDLSIEWLATTKADKAPGHAAKTANDAT